MPYINERWLGGMLTNFNTIAGRVKKMQEYERMRAAGDFDAMPKKEALILSRELDKLQRNLGGIRNMTRLPDAVFIIDTKKEHIAVTEANKLGLPDRRRRRHQLRPRPDHLRHPGQRRRHPGRHPDVPGHRRRRRRGRFIASRRAARTGARSPAGPPVIDPEEEARRAEQQRDARRQAALAQAEREARLAATRRSSGRAAGVAGRQPVANQERSPSRPVQRGLGVARRAQLSLGRAQPDRTSRGRLGGGPLPVEAAPDDSAAQTDNHRGVEQGHGRVFRQGCKGTSGRHRGRDDGRQEGARPRPTVTTKPPPSWLRERGLGKAAERAGRDNDEGAVAVSLVGDNAALVELKSESDFVAKSPQFVDATRRLARAVATDGEGAVADLKDVVDDLRLSLKENIEVGKVVALHRRAGTRDRHLPPHSKWQGRQRGHRRAGRRHPRTGARHCRSYRVRQAGVSPP